MKYLVALVLLAGVHSEAQPALVWTAVNLLLFFLRKFAHMCAAA